MEVQELRIGNLVNHEQTTHVIKSIGGSRVSSVWIRGTDNDVYNSSINHIKPIPLTSEWLVKLGFEKSKGNFSIDFNLGYLELEYHVIMDLWEFNIVNVGDSWDEPVSMPLKSPQFLHHLQNLYFALTGEELVLNDK